MINLKDRTAILTALGDRLRQPDEYREAVMKRTHFNNQWFTVENQEHMFRTIGSHFLDEELLANWLDTYPLPDSTLPRTVGLVMAGNIPLVGFHDLLCTFAAGHRAQIKLSDKDRFLIPYLLRELKDIEPAIDGYFAIVEKLQSFDAVIATGSNNSSRYFQAYFGKYPHIIRKNRHGVAVLTGRESADDLTLLGKDVFQYFGLGCRNVSKVYVPRGYSFDPLLEALHTYREIILNSKYKNNFDYNFALHVLNKEPYLANGCILLIENEAIPSRIASLHYEFYDDLPTLEQLLREKTDEIQCIVSSDGILGAETVGFGKSQEPALADYADNVDTIRFLLNLEAVETN